MTSRMFKSPILNAQPFEDFALQYDDWFERNKSVYESELKAVKNMLPKRGEGIEIGVGSAKFAGALGIKAGIDPSLNMLRIAKQRGVKSVCGAGEAVPFRDSSFDYVLMVTTICFLSDVQIAFAEIHRVLKQGGYFINAFIDKKSFLGKRYEKHKEENPFYRLAQFYSTGEVLEILKRTGFHDFQITQTIFRDLRDANTTQPVKPGYGEGAFTVIKAKRSFC